MKDKNKIQILINGTSILDGYVYVGNELKIIKEYIKFLEEKENLGFVGFTSSQ